LEPNSGCLSVFTNDKGGIKDDLVVSKTDEGYLYVVSNAGCLEKDLEHLQVNSDWLFIDDSFQTNVEQWRKQNRDVKLKVVSQDYGLIAVQGPESMLLLETDVDIDLSKLYFMQTSKATVFGVKDCRITRCGYTGEDGFEVGYSI
jgi:aminomethyltransferase